MNFQLRHCSIWSCLGLPCAAFPTRPRALHTLILFNFLFYFQKLFVYFSLSLSTAFAATFSTRPRALHTLILFNFLFYFQKLFVYFSLSLSTAFAATFSTRPCALHTPFFSSQLSFATKTSCSLVTLFLLFCTFPDIHHNCFKFTFFLSPACLHFDILLSKCI